MSDDLITLTGTGLNASSSLVYNPAISWDRIWVSEPQGGDPDIERTLIYRGCGYPDIDPDTERVWGP